MTDSQMPSDLAEAHQAINSDVHELHEKWHQWKYLFCTDDETVTLMKYAASLFFMMVGNVLRDDVIQSVCRLTDPEESMGKPNLSLKRLAQMIPESDLELREDIGLLAGDVETKTEKFRVHRNKRISHQDYDTVGSKNSAELKVPHFTRFTACQIIRSQPLDFIRQPWKLGDFRR